MHIYTVRETTYNKEHDEKFRRYFIPSIDHYPTELLYNMLIEEIKHCMLFGRPENSMMTGGGLSYFMFEAVANVMSDGLPFLPNNTNELKQVIEEFKKKNLSDSVYIDGEKKNSVQELQNASDCITLVAYISASLKLLDFYVEGQCSKKATATTYNKIWSNVIYPRLTPKTKSEDIAPYFDEFAKAIGYLIQNNLRMTPPRDYKYRGQMVVDAFNRRWYHPSIYLDEVLNTKLWFELCEFIAIARIYERYEADFDNKTLVEKCKKSLLKYRPVLEYLYDYRMNGGSKLDCRDTELNPKFSVNMTSLYHKLDRTLGKMLIQDSHISWDEETGERHGYVNYWLSSLGEYLVESWKRDDVKNNDFNLVNEV